MEESPEEPGVVVELFSEPAVDPTEWSVEDPPVDGVLSWVRASGEGQLACILAS